MRPGTATPPSVPARRAALRAVQRRAPRTHRRRGVARAAPRQPRRPHPRPQRARARRRRRRGRVRRHGHPGGGRRRADRREDGGAGRVAEDGATRGDTCHLDIVDRWGNMVAATPSGGWLQSNPVVPELGFPLGTRLQMAWLDEGLPNSLTPGRRPRTTLTPSLALRDGVPGAGVRHARRRPAGPVAGPLLPRRRAARRRSAAGSTCRAPSTHRTGTTTASPAPSTRAACGPAASPSRSAWTRTVIEELRRRGHDVTVGEPWSEGRLCAVARDPETGVLSAAANPRGMQGYAVGR